MTWGIGHKHVPFLGCELSCASSSVLLDQKTSYILNKCGVSLHCGWAYVFSELQLYQMICCIGRKYWLFLCCGWSCVSSSCLHGQMTFYILSKCGASLHCGWACVFSDVLFDQMIFGIEHNCASFFHCGYSYVSPFCCGLAKIWNALQSYHSSLWLSTWNERSESSITSLHKLEDSFLCMINHCHFYFLYK